MKTLLTMVIVHWNNPELLKKQLTILCSTNQFQIIVVDNNSNNPVSWIKKKFPKIELIENKFNQGYAFASNQGVIKAVGEWILFLNPDVEINSQQIFKFIEYAENNKLAACSVQTSKEYQKPLPSWQSLLLEFSPLSRFFSLDIFKQKTLFGGCLLIRANVIRNLGGWDERFFLWFEDSDLTKRLVDNGYKTGCADIPLSHQGGVSFKHISEQTKKDIFFNSMHMYAQKHFGFFGRLAIRLIKRKYTKRNLLPELWDGISITVPNMKLELLNFFFEKNISHLNTSGVIWTIVTSGIKGKDIWEWRKNFPHIRFVPIKINKGFASTVNIGFQVSTGRLLGTVNDDVTLTKNWLEECLACADKTTGSINPIIYRSNGKIESVGTEILPKGKALPIRDYHIDNGRAKMVSDSCQEVEATNAAAVIYSKDALNKIGLFDEKFGSYLEDIDLSLRLKRAGYKNVVAASAKVFHAGHQTAKDLGIKKQLYDFRNWIYVIIKNWSIKNLILNLPQIFLERLHNISGIIKYYCKTNTN